MMDYDGQRWTPSSLLARKPSHHNPDLMHAPSQFSPCPLGIFEVY